MPPVVLSRLRPGLGTFVAVETESGSQAQASAGIDAAYSAIAQVEVLMHPTRAGSDLAAILAADVGEAVAIHAWTGEVIALSQRLHRESGGSFDPCLPDRPGHIVDLDLKNSEAVIVRVPVHLDLGGIAKGFAVDQALEALRAAGCDAGLVNAGGDLAVFGIRSRDILCRSADGTHAVVALQDAALATSDAQETARPAEHRGYYHGLQRHEINSGKITVKAARAAIADGLTKCLLAQGAASSGTLLAAFGAQLIAG